MHPGICTWALTKRTYTAIRYEVKANEGVNLEDDDENACPTSGTDAQLAACHDANDTYINGTADLDHAAGTGTGRWYITEFAKARTGRTLFYLGFYDDTYRRSADDRWRFASRRLERLYQGPPDLSGEFGPPPGYYTA